ncbi:MAG: hypothetical protein BGO51_08535 [Rhodospirillales bacterium 69-11]|nr:GNAT family N-acetyltransferase [Rhodospirillales bacterium]OJW25981.1 MAG: hypothetical protein BGO51_08535 [Rhodospirillales bacterium 69-11]
MAEGRSVVAPDTRRETEPQGGSESQQGRDARHGADLPHQGSADGRYVLRPPACAGDWASYHTIRQDVLLEAREFSLDHPPEEEERAPLHHPMLLWCDDRPIGTIRIDRLEGDRAAFRLVAIDPPAQGRGHGRRLLGCAERFAREIGCRTIVVYATPEAAGFYARSGYVEDVWDESCVGGIVQMMKPLAEG